MVGRYMIYLINISVDNDGCKPASMMILPSGVISSITEKSSNFEGHLNGKIIELNEGIASAMVRKSTQ